MIQLPVSFSDMIYSIQQLIYQPTTRRTAVASTTLGFTIVELLIVIVVIGILAAIVVVALNGVQNSAHDSTVRSDLQQNAKKIERFKIESTNGLYPTNATDLSNADVRVSRSSYAVNRNNIYYCRSSDGTRYAIGAVSRSGRSYYLLNGAITQVNGVDSAGTCVQVGYPADPPQWANATGHIYDTATATGTWQAWAKP